MKYLGSTTDNKDIATKNYVDVAVASAGSGLPDQTGQSGKFLTTNGTAASWNNIPLFCVTYETTPYATIKAAHDAGYLCYMINSSLIYILIQANSEVCAFTLTGESTGFSTVSIIRVTSSDVWSSTWLDAQSKITASGILKGNGSGGITAATAGTDYQAPLPSQSGQSGKFLTTNGTTMSWTSLPVYNGAVQ